MNESEDRIKPKLRKVHGTKEISTTSQKARFKILTHEHARRRFLIMEKRKELEFGREDKRKHTSSQNFQRNSV
jgi:hypothetical protein